MKDGWQGTMIDEVCDITSSKRIYRADYEAEGVPFYRGKEIIEKQRGVLDVSTELFISEEKFQAIEKKFGAPHPGDLLLTSVGTLGVPYIVKPGERFYFKDGNLTWFRNLRNIDNRFLYYWLLSPMGKAQLGRSTIGSSQPALTIVLLKQMEIDLPNFPTQRKIAAILSAYDDLIKNNLRRIKILEEMAQTLYREWFVKFRFPGHEKVRMVDTSLGKIPEGWEVMAVGDTFEILGGGTPSKKVEGYWAYGDIMWYVPSDLTASKAMFMDSSRSQITELGLKKSSARLFPPFSVMMTSRATLGVIAINTTEACTNQGFITCLPNERFPLYNLYHWLMENVETFVSLASGATFKEITKGVFKTIELMVPDQPIARAFENIVNPLAEHVLNLQRRNANLKHTRDLLLPKLITGELDVCDLNISTHQDSRGDFSHE